ncbi:hypothetical protein GALMADRAFT_256536 [Galerina marginata CBS 339.88]|uniref:Uncharacterized protein n=1 Tax=Galerina marginata (strain CBS 339.88) TaxID=685588 RepID=A0A067SLX0_GALM3|nr:hypothetical protein GALMADRAFT_256536 [Galerina marginata CBS 339.88]
MPLHVTGDPLSILERITAGYFEGLPIADAQEMLRKRNIMITGVEHQPPEFNEHGGFESIETRMNALVPIQGQSLEMNQVSCIKQQRVGTLAQLLDASRQENGRIMNSFALKSLNPVGPAHFSSCLEALLGTEGRPFCEQHYPTNENFWERRLTRKGAQQSFPINADGLCTRFEVRRGGVWAVFDRPRFGGCKNNQIEHDSFKDKESFPSDFAATDMPDTFSHYEAVYLTPGNSLLLVPGTRTMIYAIERSICQRSYFYTTSKLTDTLSAIVHDLIAGGVVRDNSCQPYRALLLRMIHYFHEEFIVLGHNIKEFGHLPNLNSMVGLLDFLTLCNIGILFNVLDRRTYEPSTVDSLQAQEYDWNTIPDYERQRFVYARGLSLELLHWLASKFAVMDVRDNAGKMLDIETMHSSHIIQQGLYILQHLERRVEEEVKDSLCLPMANKVMLRRQLAWAMHTIPWVGTSWTEAVEKGDSSGSLNCIECDSFKSVPRDIQGGLQLPWASKKVRQMGLTAGDRFLQDELSGMVYPERTAVNRHKSSKRELDQLPLSPRNFKRRRVLEI